jgi:hypothetical protein
MGKSGLGRYSVALRRMGSSLQQELKVLGWVEKKRQYRYPRDISSQENTENTVF